MEWAAMGPARLQGRPVPAVPRAAQAVNLIRRYAPKAAIAFNGSGGDSVEAAAQRL
jgi:hypothetical protein